MPENPSRNVFIAAISSDIGKELAQLYLAEGCKVFGTFRADSGLSELRSHPDVQLVNCDITQPQDLERVSAELQQLGFHWDTFISAVGQLSPIGNFLDVGRDQWVNSVAMNGVQQLALLHTVAPFRRSGTVARVAFLVGGAINRGFPNYSAYSLGKLQLVKFCELIHHEAVDMHAVAIGTGWVATKIHGQTLEAQTLAGDNYQRTIDFLNHSETGTSIAEIKSLIDWCFAQPRDVTGGRNFSVVHDPWRNGGTVLIKALRSDDDGYRLRRHGNMSLGRTTTP
jgi:NAD(P)-dependent dehydrogenase (short-subunit alcohol dehydrogenase family)